MRDDSFFKRRREFLCATLVRQNISREISSQVSAFQKDWHSILLRERFSGNVHLVKRFDFSPTQDAGLIQIWSNNRGHRKQAAGVLIDCLSLQQSIAGAGDHYRIYY